MVERLTWQKRLLVFGMSFMLIMNLAWYCYKFIPFNDNVYYIYTKSSVGGLKVGSAVTFKGVEVGTVSAIDIILPEADVIKLTLRLKSSFPVYSNYRASSVLRGLSGYANIDLKKVESSDAFVLSVGSSIAYEASGWENAVESGLSVLKSLSDLLSNLTQVMGKKDLMKLKRRVLQSSHSIKMSSEAFKLSIEGLKTHLEGSVGDLKKGLSSLNLLFQNLNNDYKHVQSAFYPKSSQLFSKIEEVVERIQSSVTKKRGIWKWFA